MMGPSTTDDIQVRRTDVEPKEQLVQLRKDFDNHKKDYESYKKYSIKSHRRCEQFRLDAAYHHKSCLQAIEQLTMATQGIVDGWVAVNGFLKVLVWLASLSGLAAGLKWLFNISFGG